MSVETGGKTVYMINQRAFIGSLFLVTHTKRATEKLESETSAVKEIVVFEDQQDQLKSNDWRSRRH